MAADESLFSLEVYVEIVESICFSCYKPAIAFRFLDFPSVVIRPGSEELCSDETSLQIQSGKSCLFKMSKEMLGERLRSTPLYVMLVDISSGRTKLLASTTISMVKCFENILTNIEENGLDMPAVSGRKGGFNFYNLMGSHVGTVKLRYRMFSFGSGMSGHVNLSLSRKQGNKENIQSDSLPEQCEGKNTHIRQAYCRTENNTTESKISDIPDKRKILVKENITLRTDIETQTESAYAKQLNVVQVPQQKYSNYPEPLSVPPHNNISRPPPLYYNSISTFTKARVMPGHSVRTPKEETTSKQQYCDRSMQTCRPSHRSSTNVINMSSQQEDASTQCPSKYDLPLIEALLNELSLVKAQHGNNDEFSQRCNKDGLPPFKNKQIKIGSTTDVSSKRSQVQKNKGPRNYFSKPKPTRASGKGVLISRHPIKFKKSSLTYGTTKTQKLREAINKKSGHSEQNTQVRECQIEPALCEDKHEEFLQEHNNMMQGGQMVTQKSKQIFREHKSTMTQNGDTQFECKDIGVQVKINEDDLHSASPEQKQQSHKSQLGCDGTTNIILGATYINDVIPASTVRMVTANPHENTDQISASYSSPKEAEDISPNNAPFSNLSDAPTFSNVSPTVLLSRNDGNNSEKSSKESIHKSLSLGSRSSEKSLDLVNKPVGEILVDSSYSDNFDSDESEQMGGDDTS